MVVNTFLRKTYVVLPTPIRRAIKFALPKKAQSEVKPKRSFLEDIDAMADSVLGPLWKE